MKEHPEKKKPDLKIVGGTDVPQEKPEEKPEPEKEKRDYAAELEALGILKRGGSERAEGPPKDTPHDEDSER